MKVLEIRILRANETTVPTWESHAAVHEGSPVPNGHGGKVSQGSRSPPIDEADKIPSESREPSPIRYWVASRCECAHSKYNMQYLEKGVRVICAKNVPKLHQCKKRDEHESPPRKVAAVVVGHFGVL